MTEPLTTFPKSLLSFRDGPCVSLYQPTNRRHPENQQDPIRFRNLVKQLAASLRRKFPEEEADALLTEFGKLAADRDFWNHALDGLAVFAADGLFRVFRLQRTVPEIAVVSNSFHTKPLLRIVQSADRYQILAVNRSAIRLFEGNRDVVTEIEPHPEVPRTLTAALGTELTDSHLEVATYGSGPNGPAQVHGHGGRKDEVDKDAERFFRAVDRAVLKHHSQPSGLPLLLAALPEHVAMFREVSHNGQLCEAALDVHPDDLDPEELRERAWKAFEPQYLARLDTLVEEFGSARSTGLGTDDLAQAAVAAAAGRIATLLVEAEREVPGSFDPDTGKIAFDDLHNPEVDDLLDDLGESVLRTGGEVIVVPAARMPTKTGLAATFRF